MLEKNLEDLVGAKIGDDDLQELLKAARVKFHPGNVSNPTNISTGTKDPGCDTGDGSGGIGGIGGSDTSKDMDRIDGLIASVKENEDYVKLLEDMQDELLKDMNIEPSNKNIKDAALKINGDGNPNITKDTFDKANAIKDIFGTINTGFSAELLPILGNANITTDFYSCLTRHVHNSYKPYRKRPLR